LRQHKQQEAAQKFIGRERFPATSWNVGFPSISEIYTWIDTINERESRLSAAIEYHLGVRVAHATR